MDDFSYTRLISGATQEDLAGRIEEYRTEACTRRGHPAPDSRHVHVSMTPPVWNLPERPHSWSCVASLTCGPLEAAGFRARY